jgi:hypothetical protein
MIEHINHEVAEALTARAIREKLGADPRHAGAIPGADRCRSRPLGAGDRGGEYQDQLSAISEIGLATPLSSI